MKTIAKSCQLSAEAKTTVKRVRESVKVAEWYWNTAFVLMCLAGCSENVVLAMIGVALLASATLHRLKVERKNRR